MNDDDASDGRYLLHVFPLNRRAVKTAQMAATSDLSGSEEGPANSEGRVHKVHAGPHSGPLPDEVVRGVFHGRSSPNLVLRHPQALCRREVLLPATRSPLPATR